MAKDILLSVTGSNSTKECVDSEKKSPLCKEWECHSECRPLKLPEVEAIGAALELPVDEAREVLAKCYLGCPWTLYKYVGSRTIAMKGHHLVCDYVLAP